MKQLTIMITLILTTTLANNSMAQDEIKTLQIKTSAQCEECKERIEKAMVYEKGVKRASLVPGDQKAYNKLPICCQKGGMEKK